MIKRNLSFTFLIAIGLIFMSNSPKAQNAPTPTPNPTNSNAVEINTDLLNVLQKNAELKKASAKKAEKLKQQQQPKNTNKLAPAAKFHDEQDFEKSETIIEQEKELEDLKKRYFPERYKEEKKQKIERLKQKELDSKKQKLEEQKKNWQQKRIKSRKSMPLPAQKPGKKAKIRKQTTTVKTVKKAPPKIIDLTAKPIPQQTAPNNDKDSNSGTNKIVTPKDTTSNGKKLVSIAYIDQEISINANVQNALRNNYISKMKKKRSKRIGIHSYATTHTRTEEEAQNVALKRAKSLKRFLVNQGLRSDMIDLHPVATNDANSFSDWIDIRQER